MGRPPSRPAAWSSPAALAPLLERIGPPHLPPSPGKTSALVAGSPQVASRHSARSSTSGPAAALSAAARSSPPSTSNVRSRTCPQRSLRSSHGVDRRSRAPTGSPRPASARRGAHRLHRDRASGRPRVPTGIGTRARPAEGCTESGGPRPRAAGSSGAASSPGGSRLARHRRAPARPGTPRSLGVDLRQRHAPVRRDVPVKARRPLRVRAPGARACDGPQVSVT